MRNFRGIRCHPIEVTSAHFGSVVAVFFFRTEHEENTLVDLDIDRLDASCHVGCDKACEQTWPQSVSCSQKSAQTAEVC